jgi:hypothetical protein
VSQFEYILTLKVVALAGPLFCFVFGYCVGYRHAKGKLFVTIIPEFIESLSKRR